MVSNGEIISTTRAAGDWQTPIRKIASELQNPYRATRFSG